MMARKVRDGIFRGQVIRPMLPIIYEYPVDIAQDRAKWEATANWPMVMPNLGRSVHLKSLLEDWEAEKTKGDHATRIWASQHLNIEIGIGLMTDGWPGAEFWLGSEDASITLESIIEDSEAIVVGVDGGGLDDLFGRRARARAERSGGSHGRMLGATRACSNGASLLRPGCRTLRGTVSLRSLATSSMT
jgi:phage terminase large subunit-like protein